MQPDTATRWRATKELDRFYRSWPRGPRRGQVPLRRPVQSLGQSLEQTAGPVRTQNRTRARLWARRWTRRWAQRWTTAPPHRPDIRQVVFKMPQTPSVAFRRCLKTVQKAFARSLGPVILQMQKLSCYSHLYRYRRFRPRCGTGRPPPDPGPHHARPANVFQKRNIAAPNREQTMSITAA